MDEKQPLEVSDWHDEPRPVSRTADPVVRWPRIPARVLGAIGTLLLHGLVIQTAVLGSSAKKISSSTTQGLASTANAAGAESEMTLVVIQPIDPSDPKDNSLFEELGSRGSSAKNVPISLISPQPLEPLSFQQDERSDPAAEAPVISGDLEGQARLFGLYSGQIKARIDRVWRRPRTPVNDDRMEPHDAIAEESFRCQVRIIQDPQGNVQEILLPQCNGSSAWKRSLFIAIQQASPLPAPPSPTVFSQALTLEFVGFSYAATRNDDDYEVAKPLMVESGANRGGEK